MEKPDIHVVCLNLGTQHNRGMISIDGKCCNLLTSQ